MPKTASATRVTPCTWEVFFAPLDTAFPDADEAIAAPWTSIGIVQDDPELTPELEEGEINASNVCTTVRKFLKSRKMEWSLDQAQWTQATVENYFGAGTWTASGAGEQWNTDGLTVPEKAMLFQLIDGDAEMRIGHPKVAITPSGPITFATDDLAKLPVTATVLEPDSGSSITIFVSAELDAA